MTSLTHLLCEHLSSPLGVESPAPRLSWCLASTRRGAHQTAYRLVVASNESLLTANTPDLWDSSRVASDTSILVPYAGKPLRSRQACHWRVHVWDDKGTEIISSPARWEMGLLKASDWNAQWITAPTPKPHHDVPASPLIRKSFRLTQPIARARAYICGLGFHEFYLNGRKIGDAVLHPAFTKYDARALYTVHDITANLTQGDNAAGLTLGTGWYHHHTQDVWNLFAAPWIDVCKAIVQIEILHTNGRRTTVISDTSWQWSTGPIVFDGLRNGEIYDARAEKPGWCDAAYKPTDWKPAEIARHPGGALRAQLMPPCRVTETLHPKSLAEVRPGVWIYDLGHNIAGWARLTLQGPAGTTVTLRYSERLGPDGDIDRKDIAGLLKTDVFQTDTYIMKGAGLESYETRFTYHGFQYVQLTGLTGPATLDMLAGRVVHTDLEHTGLFDCSNPLLNQIQAAALRATRSNYHGMPTDCPQREKNGWTGDAHLSAEQVLYNFEPTTAYTKWLDDFTDCQRASGAFPGIVPTGGWGYNWGAGPAWDSAYILIPWYLYLYRGDLAILRHHYAGMLRYLSYLDGLATNHIVHFGLGDWCPPSPGPDSHKAPAPLTNTAYYHADTRLVARIATLLGKPADARRLEKLANKIKSAARNEFYDPNSGKLAGHSQTSIACFLYQGLVEPNEVESFTRMLLDEVTAANDHIDCGILGTKYVFHVLRELGHNATAYRIATQTDFPSWGHWIAQGATTLWEVWDGTSSRNHHMFSDISAWFYQALAGILPDPAHPGFKHTIIKPCPVGDLTHARGEIRTPYGPLKSSWRRDAGRFFLELSIPPNTTATVHLPTPDASTVRESNHATFQGIEQNRAVFRIASGQYHFEVATGGAAAWPPSD